MTVFDLLDSIGNVDDKLIERVKQPKKSHKKTIIIGSLAACAVIACTGILMTQNVQRNIDIIDNASDTGKISSDILYSDVSDGQWAGSESPETANSEFSQEIGSDDMGTDTWESQATGGAGSQAPHNEDSVEIEEANMPFEVYYVVNKNVEHKTLMAAANPKDVFEIWKGENHIGGEVKLVNVRIEDSGNTTVSEYSGIEVATHTSGEHTVYNLTVTKNLENYYNTDRDLLLESLEKTMTGMCEQKPEEYKLILEDEEHEEESESNWVDSDDIRCNNKGEILE